MIESNWSKIHMQIIYKNGDLMAADEHYIVHGCNAQGVMGSGVAALIREKYPTAYKKYHQASKDSGLKIGQVIWARGDHSIGEHTVINAITQEFYGRDPNVVYCSYDGIRAAFREINDALLSTTGDSEIGVAMPLIGCGLGGAKWSIVSSIIEEESQNFIPVVYTLDGVIPKQ